MADRLVICPLCGFEFAAGDALCSHGCPLSAYCSSIRCPSCEYEFPVRPRPFSWLFRRRREAAEKCRLGEGAEAATVRQMEQGDRARVVTVHEGTRSRRNTLAVFGVTPGSEIRLLQRRPAFVLEVGETHLALDPEIAGEIVVEPL